MTEEQFHAACRNLHADESDPVFLYWVDDWFGIYGTGCRHWPGDYLAACVDNGTVMSGFRPCIAACLAKAIDPAVVGAYLWLFHNYDAEEIAQRYVGYFTSYKQVVTQELEREFYAIPKWLQPFFKYGKFVRRLLQDGKYRAYNGHFFRSQ
jgi:hypothetical protein